MSLFPSFFFFFHFEKSNYNHKQEIFPQEQKEIKYTDRCSLV